MKEKFNVLVGAVENEDPPEDVTMEDGGHPHEEGGVRLCEEGVGSNVPSGRVLTKPLR